MPTPAHILAVSRPVNTIVRPYGKNKDRYAVIQRVGCRRVNGKNIPVNGPTIGHIENGVFVPIEQNNTSIKHTKIVEMKDWANIILCDKISSDLLNDIGKFYSYNDALEIYCISMLRVCYPGIADYKLQEYFNCSFLSELYPNACLSKNSVSNLHNGIGKEITRVQKFMRDRVDKVDKNCHILIDGTLKRNNSKINSLSDFSRKPMTRGTKDISVLYAFNLTEYEPLCSQSFPENMPDVTSFNRFVKDNNINKALLVCDRWFPSSVISEYKKDHPDLHTLNPLKINSSAIKNYHLYEFSTPLSTRDGTMYRKEKSQTEEKWYYSFRDNELAMQEENEWIRIAKKNGIKNNDNFEKRRKSFGVIVLECDLDLSPEVIYSAYSDRWQIEIVMKYYKHALSFDTTRMHNDYSVIGSEFCDFISTIITFRLIKKFNSCKLLEKNTYSNILKILRRAKKIRDIEYGQWIDVKINPSQRDVLEQLELIPPTKPSLDEPKRGRPRKKNRPDQVTSGVTSGGA